MADFNVNLEAPHASGAKVISPVQSSVQAMPNPWLAFGLNVAGALVENHVKQQKTEKEAREQAVVDTFAREQTLLSDAIQQGRSPAEINTRAMSNFNKAVAANPSLSDKFAAVNKNLFDYSALSVAKDSATLAKELRTDQLKTLQKSGSIVNDTTPPNVIEAEWNSHQTNVRVEAEFGKMRDRMTLMASMNAEERAATKAKMEADAGKLMAEMGDSKIPAMFTMMEHLVAEKEKSTDPKSLEIAKGKMLQEFSRVEGALNALSQHAPQLAASYKKQFDDIKAFTTERLEGKLAAADIENRLKVLKDTATYSAMTSDPNLKTMYALSSVVGGQNFTSIFGAQQAQARESYIKLTSKFGGNPYEFFTNTEVDKVLGKQIQYQVGRVEKGEIPNREAAMGQLGNGANNILLAIAAAPHKQIEPSKMTSAIEFIASPEYAKLRDAGKIDQTQATAANKAFGLFYRESVSKGVMEQLDKPFRLTTNPQGQNISYKDLVKFEWDGMSVKAGATGGRYMSLMEKGDHDLFISKMQNSTKAINHLVNAGANLEGIKPEVYWEQNKHNILPNYYPDPAKLIPGQVVKAKNGKNYKYLGGNMNDIENSYMEMPDTGTK